MKKLLITLTAFMALAASATAQQTNDFPKGQDNLESKRSRTVSTLKETRPTRTLDTDRITDATRAAQAEPLEHVMVSRRKNNDVPSTHARIHLMVDSVNPKHYGYQLLMDQTAKGYGVFIPTGDYDDMAGFKQNVHDSVYAKFSHKLPSNANGILETPNSIFNDSVHMDIPQGIYDLVMTNPTDIYIAIPFKARLNNYNFVGGYEYFFIVRKGAYSATNSFEYPFLGQVVAKVKPTSSQLSSAETLTVLVKNLGFLDDGLNCPINYSINNGEVVTETMEGPSAGQSKPYSFNQKMDLSAPGKYTIKVWLSLPNAIYHGTDTIIDSVFTHSPINLPIIDSFPNTEEGLFKSKWAQVDANADGVCWTFDKWGDADGNSNSGSLRYFYAPKLKADDYLVSKPFNATAGEHHISFDFDGRGASKDEELEIYYGTSPNPEDMTFLNRMTFNKTGKFRPYVRNFTIESDGVYYVALRAVSQENAYGMNIDNITIAAGRAQSEPNISFVRGRLPYASCDMSSSSTIGVELVNNGTFEAESYTLSYSINGGTAVSETFTQIIEPYKSAIVYFDTKADLSEQKEYNVKFEANVEGQTTTTQAYESSTHHLSSVHIPYSSRVSTPEGVNDYYSVVEGHWIFDNGVFRTNGEFKFPLVSRCFYSEAQMVRFSFDFTAGGEGLWGPTTDDLMILLGKSGTERKDWDTIAILKDQYHESLVTGAIKFMIPEAGDYIVAIEPFRSPMSIKIASFKIEKVYDKNLQAIALMAPNMGSIMPESQVAASHLMVGYIRNYGKDTLYKTGYKIIQGTQDLGSSATADTLLPDAAVSIQKVVNLNKVNPKDTLKLLMSTMMTATDQLASDDQARLNIEVSDSVFAIDTYRFLSEEPFDAIGGKNAIRLGTIVNIANTDTITSISIGFAEVPSNRNFKIALYKITAAPNTGGQAFEIDARRGPAGGLFTYSVPPTIVTPGMWYIEVQQLNSDNYYVLTDLNPNGVLYQNNNGRLSYLDTRGNMVIRPNFGRSNAKIFTNDATVESIQGLRTEGVYRSKESISATVKNLGSADLTGKIICSVDGANVQEKSLKLLAYERKDISFEVDLSSIGEHQVLIQVAYTGDQNDQNDELSQTYTCNAVNPYVLDFEECSDFSIDSLVPAWTMYDGDTTKSYIFEGITFPNDTAAKAFLVFNPSQTSPSALGSDDFSTFEGERCAMAMAVEGKRNDDWLISPKLKMGVSTKLKFHAASMDLGFGKEQVNVLVSTTDNKPSSFTRIGDTILIDSAWHAYEVDLAAYNDQDIHVAIQCVSDYILVLKIDNIEIDTDLTNAISPEKRPQFAMNMYPNPAQDFVTITSEYAIETLQVLDAMGRNLHMIRNSVSTKEMTLPIKGFGKGMFYIMIDTPAGQQTQKLIIQ